MGHGGLGWLEGVQSYPIKELWGLLLPLALELEAKQLPVSHTYSALNHWVWFTVLPSLCFLAPLSFE